MSRVFFNIDTQKDFMNAEGALYVQDAEKIKPVLAKLTDYAQANGIIVINTADYHNIKDDELSDNPDYCNTFPPHCMSGTEGMEYVEESNPVDSCYECFPCDEELLEGLEESRNIIIYKDKFSVFEGNKNTTKILDELEVVEAIVYGVATNVCVNQAVLGLLNMGIKVRVVFDAIKELPASPVTKIYADWLEKGVSLISSEDILG